MGPRRGPRLRRLASETQELGLRTRTPARQDEYAGRAPPKLGKQMGMRRHDLVRAVASEWLWTSGNGQRRLKLKRTIAPDAS